MDQGVGWIMSHASSLSNRRKTAATLSVDSEPGRSVLETVRRVD
jgi:hypothetical protein